ncbi:MAG: 4Fe-4S binding protein [Desulfovibrio sp.]|nr:4Fe-4S binding protein [Desulfovibrio sp.]
MFGILKERLHQKYRTLDYPAKEPFLPPHFKGRPSIAPCSAGDCRVCQEVCPTGAVSRDAGGHILLDLGRCIFCGLCEESCPEHAIAFSRTYRLAARTREELIVRQGEENRTEPSRNTTKGRALFSKSLTFRQVSAGGCAACEADTNVLNTLLYDLGRFGISFAASPRHADGLVVTGPVTTAMQRALVDTYLALPAPRLLVALGTCAISRGLFADSPECLGIPDDMKIDLYIPGCPPNPWTILDGFLSLQQSPVRN